MRTSRVIRRVRELRFRMLSYIIESRLYSYLSDQITSVTDDTRYEYYQGYIPNRVRIVHRIYSLIFSAITDTFLSDAKFFLGNNEVDRACTYGIFNSGFDNVERLLTRIRKKEHAEKILWRPFFRRRDK